MVCCFLYLKPFIERCELPLRVPGTLMDKFLNSGAHFAIAAVSQRNQTGAEPLTPAQERANERGEFVGGTNTLPYDLRPTDDLRGWNHEEEWHPPPPLEVDIPGQWPNGPYPTNTTGPRFLRNAPDPYWYSQFAYQLATS